MFRPFLDSLRRHGVPVSLREYLDLLGGMAAGVAVTRIGAMSAGNGVTVRDPAGAPVQLAQTGYDHFK